MKRGISKVKTHIFRVELKWLIAALVAFLCVLVGTISYAETPEYAQIVQLSGDRLQFQLGSQRPEPARAGQQLRNNSQALIIPGNNSSWSTLAFITSQPKDSARMTVAAGPESRDTIFRFPCQSEGGLILVSWEQGSDRGCEIEGFRVGRRNRNAQLPSSNNHTIAQKNKNVLAQASNSDDVTVKPDASEEKFFEGIDTGNSVNIIAIRGSFTVISQQFPQGKTLRQSEQYIYLGNGQGRIEPIDLRPVINSRPVQNFLNSNNWSSPDLPQRVASSIGNQVNDLRTALAQPTQPVASTPRISVTETSTAFNPTTPTSQTERTPTPSARGNGRCGQQQVSGGQAGDVRKIQLSRASGKVYIAYDMCPVPDTLLVYYEGKKLLEKTVSGSGIDELEIGGTSTELTVEVIGNPKESATRWGYILSCPDDGKVPQPPAACFNSSEPSTLDRIQDVIRDLVPIPIPRLPF